MNECIEFLRMVLFSIRHSAFPFKHRSVILPTELQIEKTFKYYFSSFSVDFIPMSRMYGFTGNFICINQAWDGDILISLLKNLETLITHSSCP